jgi:acetyl esterase/lipase
MRTEHYSTEDGRSMPMDVFGCDGAPDDVPRPAILFLHGGAWIMGDRAQFHPQCERFAAAGFVAATASYSIGVSILQCGLDARAAVEHVLTRGQDRLVDPERVAVGGGSAGGHLAACLGTCEIVRPSIAPAALVLFNPVLDLAASVAALGELAPVVGAPTERLSPIAQDLGHLPPTIVFHGTKDSLVSVDQSRAFRDAATAAGARCELREFEGREHAFFNRMPPEFADALNFGDFETTTVDALAFVQEVVRRPG